MRIGGDVLNDIVNMDIFKKNNTDLVHYSLTNRGSALYYQKMIITKIFRTSGLELHTYGNNYNNAIRTLSMGGRFQQKYCLISNIHQLRRNVGSLFWNNNQQNYGTLKNFFNKSSKNSSDSFLKNDQESIRSDAVIERGFNYMTHFCIVSTAYNFINKVRSAYKIYPMKSKFKFDIHEKIVLFDKCVMGDKVKEFVIKTFTNLNYFIRTVWYKNILHLNNFNKPVSFMDNEGYYRKILAKTQRYGWIIAGDSKNNYFMSLGIISNRWVDVAKELRLRNSGGVYKRYVKKYPRWRLGIVHWGKKILKFRKNYLFWKYMRGLSTYFYRGYYLNSVFNCRVDVYALRMFGIRTLKFARLLVSSGHIFIGDFQVKNAKTQVIRYNVVSLSKKANIFINKKRYFKFWKNNTNYLNKKIQSRLIKMTPLMFCRQQKNSLFWGEIKNIKYSMFFGRSIHVLNSESKKTKYFALNYFYIQKSVASAWW